MILPPSKPFALNMFWNVDFSVATVKIKSSWTKGPLPSNGGGTAAPITGQMVSSYYLAVRINAGCMSNFVSSLYHQRHSGFAGLKSATFMATRSGNHFGNRLCRDNGIPFSTRCSNLITTETWIFTVLCTGQME